MIKEALEALGITKKELASIMCVDPRTVRSWASREKSKIPKHVREKVQGLVEFHKTVNLTEEK